MKVDKILITGGFGFIGSNMVKRFLSRKKYKIILIDKLTYSTEYNINFFKKNKNLKHYKEDINNRKNISRILQKEKPNIIINLAAESHVDNSIKSKKKFLDTNIMGVDSLFEACKNNLDLEKIKIIHFSTDEVYGSIPNGKISNENNPFKPSSFYSSSKSAGESLAYTYLKFYSFPVFILNPCNIYGPFQHSEKFIPKIILNSILKKNIPLYGNGNQKRQWLYVDNLIKYIERTLFKSNKFGKYNISSNFEMSNFELIKMIHSIIIKEYKIKNLHKLITKVEDRKAHDIRYFSSNKKILDTFGNKKLLVSNEQIFKKSILNTISWYSKNRKKF